MVSEVGWPDTREQVPISIREYWNFREDLTLHNGILFKSQRIIIPRALRSEVTARLHSSHLGIEACLRKARDRVYWPAMNSDIKEAVAKCEVCAEYQANNPQQPLQTRKIPDKPWSRLAADLFTLHSKDYIVLVDYYSDFVEVSPLEQTTSSAIIKSMRVQFSRHGIPDVLVSDNGPQFASREFAEFAKQWAGILTYHLITLPPKVQRKGLISHESCQKPLQESPERQQRPLDKFVGLQKYPYS